MIANTVFALTLKDGPMPLFSLEKGTALYGWDGQKISVAIIEDIAPVGEMDVVRVLLDNDHGFRLTDLHPILTRNGETDLAGSLEAAASLLPLYLKENANGYLEYQQLRLDRSEAPEKTDQRRYRPVSRMVAEAMLGHRLGPNTRIALMDRNRKNCDPGNLEIHERADGDIFYRRNLDRSLRDISETCDFIDHYKDLARPYIFRFPEDGQNHKVVGVHPCGVAECCLVRTQGEVAFAVGDESGGVFVGSS